LNMPLTDEEVRELKKQLSEQIQHLPEDKRAEAQAQIDSMSQEALETMLKQQQGQQGGEGGGQQVFRMMVSKQIDTVVVDENGDAMAILEINPLSKGHMFIIPKTQITKKEDLPEAVLTFAKTMAEKIMRHLKPKKAEIKIEEKFGEIAYEIIPEYDTPLTGQREKTSKEELEEIKKTLNTLVLESKPELITIEKKKKQKVIRLRRRIP